MLRSIKTLAPSWTHFAETAHVEHVMRECLILTTNLLMKIIKSSYITLLKTLLKMILKMTLKTSLKTIMI